MSGTITIPQANPGAGYRALKGEIDAAVARALDSGWYILGGEGRAFEEEFSSWLGAGKTVGCGNGTDAIALALRGLGIGPGCAVATVSHTAVATVAAIEMVGATPLLIDIDPVHYTLDPAALADALAHPPAGLPLVRAVILVHLYGQPGDVLAIRDLFPAAEAGWRIPLVLFPGSIGMAAGGWIAGAMYDVFGTYGPGFAVGVLANVVNLMLIGTLVLRQRSRRLVSVYS